MVEEQISINIKTIIKEEIKKKVDTGEYRNITDFIHEAIKHELNRERTEDVARNAAEKRLLEILKRPEFIKLFKDRGIAEDQLQFLYQ